MTPQFRTSAPRTCGDPLCRNCHTAEEVNEYIKNFQEGVRIAGEMYARAAQPAPVRKTADEWLNHYLERYNLAPPPPSVEEHLRSRRTDPSTKELRRTKTSKKELRRTKLAAPVPPSEEEPRTLAAASDEVPPPPDLNAILREARRR